MCDCEVPEFYWSRKVRGAKDHRCSECRIVLPKGAEHLLASGKWDGYVSSFRLCLECNALHDELRDLSDCCVGIGQAIEEVAECPEDGRTPLMLSFLARRETSRQSATP